MFEGRKCGILCPITALPNDYCIGDLGPHAYNFIDFLKHSGQSYWQVLPITVTGATNSPYQPLSLFAGNPLLISIERLYQKGLVDQDLLECHETISKSSVNYVEVMKHKKQIFENAVEMFERQGLHKSPEFKDFVEENKFWLDDYALFMALKEAYKGKAWNEWDKDLADRKPEALKKACEKYKDSILKYKVLQYWFFYQWKLLKIRANEAGIKIIGDMPMYPDFDSVTVWANKELFYIDSENRPVFVAGVPPDYFCEDGQYWGNPFYNWDTIKSDDYKFWIDRFNNDFKYYDIIRVDHFRGLSEAWKIQANPERSAKGGKWVPVPGKEILTKIKELYPTMPIIAEDLGDIDDKVRDLRDEFELPGMSILEFAFDSPNSLYLPHNQVPRRVLYTGTHDNNTVIGWWKSISEDKRSYVRKYFSIDGNDIAWQMIQAAYRTSADTVIIPIQDIMNLDEKFRMNVPGEVNNKNWCFRFTWDMLNSYFCERLRELSYLYCRN